MFRSVRLKFTVIFVLLVTVTELLIGSIIMLTALNRWHKYFDEIIYSIFTDDFINTLTDTANYVSAPSGAENGPMIVIEENRQENLIALEAAVIEQAGQFGFNASRYFCILDGKTGETLYPDNNAERLYDTQTVRAAMDGSQALENRMGEAVMEYALPLFDGNEVKYIVYVRDTGQTHKEITRIFKMLMLYAAVLSAIVSAFAAFILSQSITAPIKQLTVKAKRLADGDINALAETSSADELGVLTNTLVKLAHSRKESNDKAIGEQIKVETILQNMNDGILAFNLHGNLIHVNPEAQRLLHRKYIDDVQFDRFFKEIKAGITLGDLLYMNPEGSVEREIKLANQYLRLNFATFNVDNKVGGVIVIIHDVTRQEKLEKSRRDFVADVSHELRTPLTTIKSYSETLSDMPDVDRELQVRFLDVIASEAERMARIVSDLLTLSELDDNKTYFKMPEKIDVRKMIEILVERMGLSAKKKNQTITYHPINEVPIINGDRDGLERVVINIISNALKYTQTGGHIEIYTSKVYKDICIKVIDNGMGIPKDKLPHIFDRFYRVDKARSRDTGGTGLGLAIAKQTLESAFNGKIKIASELNKGTEVTITIPVTE